MKRIEFVAVMAFFVLLSFSQIAAQQITANVDVDDQPIPGVRVVLIASNERETRTATTDSSGNAVLDVSNVIKQRGHTEAQVVVRVCKDGKNVVYILQRGQQAPPEDQKCVNNKDCECKDRPAGFFLITDGATVRVSINPEAVNVHVTSAGGEVPSASYSKYSTPGASPTIQVRGFGGATFVNGNTPGTAGFDGAVLFPLGNRVLLGPTAGFQWVDSSIVSTIGGGPPPSTFIDTSVGFKSGNFGGRIGFTFGGWEIGVRGGATVAGSTITQNEGFCGTSSTSSAITCTVTSSSTTHDTVVGPFVGGYISHSIFSHVGVFVEGDYRHLKDGKIYDVSHPAVVAGVVLTTSTRRH